MARKNEQEDPSMAKVRALVEKSGLSMSVIGLKMDCPKETARQTVWQFLKTSDPHISLLRRFAKAMGISIQELVTETDDKAKRRKTDKHGQYRRAGDELPNVALRNPMPT